MRANDEWGFESLKEPLEREVTKGTLGAEKKPVEGCAN